MANAPRSKQAFRRSKTQATRDNATYPHFDEGRRTFLRHFGLLLAGGAAGTALVGCGDERAPVGGKPDMRLVPDSGGVATDLPAPVDPPRWRDMGGTVDAKPAPLDTQPHYADSGAAPMPLDAATRHDAGVGTDGQ